MEVVEGEMPVFASGPAVAVQPFWAVVLAMLFSSFYFNFKQHVDRGSQSCWRSMVQTSTTGETPMLGELEGHPDFSPNLALLLARHLHSTVGN